MTHGWRRVKEFERPYQMSFNFNFLTDQRDLGEFRKSGHIFAVPHVGRVQSALGMHTAAITLHARPHVVRWYPFPRDGFDRSVLKNPDLFFARVVQSPATIHCNSCTITSLTFSISHPHGAFDLWGIRLLSS
jgi:hypothetical protein